MIVGAIKTHIKYFFRESLDQLHSFLARKGYLTGITSQSYWNAVAYETGANNWMDVTCLSPREFELYKALERLGLSPKVAQSTVMWKAWESTMKRAGIKTPGKTQIQQQLFWLCKEMAKRE